MTVLFALLLPLGGRAADAPHPDSIDAATQQLDALKADANAAKAGTQSRGLPVIAVPEMHEVEAAPPAILPPANLEKDPRKRSANWLVDGVMKPDPRDPHARDARSARAGRADDRTSDRLLGDRSDRSDQLDQSDPTDPNDLATRRGGDRQAPAEDPTVKRPTNDPVFNPLTRFMGDWLSPQDATMLRQTLSAPAGADGATIPSSPAAPVVSGDSTLAAALANLGGDAALPSKPAYEPPKPVENPYLQPMALPDVAPPTANPPPADAIPAQAPAPAIQPTPVAPAEAKPLIPDFAKPLDDDKYYKPLKRF